MNLLAHYILSERNEEVVVGNIIADFLKGISDDQFSPGIRKGIELHRKIDHFSDHHPVVKETWSLLNSDFGHYGRVITDIYYDHFLFIHWDEYSDLSFAEDLEYFNYCLKKYMPVYPVRVRRTMKRIIGLQWPLKYGDMNGLFQVFRSMSRRVAFENKFELAVRVLEKNYNVIDNHFCRFFPELQSFSAQEFRKQNPVI
jgi:acyl carrier protein phosphodiesterase